MRYLTALGMKWRILLMLWAVGLIVAIALSWDQFPLVERDFAAFWTAGGLVLDGRAVDAYDPVKLQLAASQWLGTPAQIVFPYPPQFLLAVAPLATMPYQLAFWIWGAFGVILFAVAAKPYLPRDFPLVLAVVTPAALINLIFGQVGLVFGALWLFAFRGSVLAAAALTFKPHLGALVGFEMLKRGRVLVTIAAIFAMLAIVGLIFGGAIFEAFWGSLMAQADMLSSGSMTVWQNRIVSPAMTYGPWGWAAFAIAAMVLLWRRFDAFTAATAAILISPYGFHYDLPVVCLGFAIALHRHWDDSPPWQLVAIATGFLTPILVGFGSALVPPILLVALLAQTRLVARGDVECPEPSISASQTPSASS